MPNNPAKQVDPPKITHKPMKILNEAQVNIFLEATDRDPIWRDFFYTELTTGLRLGEICGLMWSDFDGRKGTLSISRTLRKEKGGRLVAGDTKTYAGTRTILLPTSTAERLRLRKKTSYSPWIFHDPLRPETLLNPGTAYRQLKKVLQETGLPELRFHDLRHTFATHALASGVDAKTLSGILGHTKSQLHPGHLHPHHRGYAEAGGGNRGRLPDRLLRRGDGPVAKRRKHGDGSVRLRKGRPLGGPVRGGPG